MFGLFRRKQRRLPDEISYDEAKKLARAKDPRVRQELAEREDIRPEILYFLAEDKRAEVRRGARFRSRSRRRGSLRPGDEDQPPYPRPVGR